MKETFSFTYFSHGHTLFFFFFFEKFRFGLDSIFYFVFSRITLDGSFFFFNARGMMIFSF
jgi:hypothetical protein